jgi:hypothetical protein
VLQRKGPLGLRSIMGLIGLTDHHSFKTLNDACASALSRGLSTHGYNYDDILLLYIVLPPAKIFSLR